MASTPLFQSGALDLLAGGRRNAPLVSKAALKAVRNEEKMALEKGVHSRLSQNDGGSCRVFPLSCTSRPAHPEAGASAGCVFEVADTDRCPQPPARDRWQWLVAATWPECGEKGHSPP